MSLEDFNRGLDDACENNFRDRFANNSDYIEGFNYGESIDNKKGDKIKHYLLTYSQRLKPVGF